MIPLDEPTAYVALNAAWDRHGDIDLILDAATHATVLGVVEARKGDGRPLDVSQVLKLGGIRRRGDNFTGSWKIAQDIRTGATSGSAIAIRGWSQVKVRRVTTWLASRAGSWRSSVQARYIKIAHVIDHRVRTRVMVVHFPIVSTGMQPEARRSLKRAVRRANRAGVRWVILGDFNTDVADLARELGGQCYTRDVMGVIWGSSLAVSRDGRGWGRMVGQHRRHDATDHAILTVTETERTKEQKR